MLIFTLTAVLSSGFAQSSAEEPAVEIVTKDVKVPGVDLIARIPQPPEDEPPVWTHSLGDATSEVKLGLRRPDAFTDLRIQTSAYQPDLDRISSAMFLWLEQQDESDESTKYTIGESRLEEHERLGSVLMIPFQVRDEHLEQDFWDQVALFAVEGAGVILTAVSSDSAERSESVLREALDMLHPTLSPLTPEELPTGRVEMPAGYSLDLPSGWRGLTEKETRERSTLRIAGDGPFSGQFARFFAVDPSELEKVVFECTASASPALYILDPAKSPRSALNFQEYATVQLKGGRYRIQSGSQERFVDVVAERPLQPTSTSDVRYIDLGDRHAYLWRVEGTLFDVPMEASVFYTAWDDVSLFCSSMVEPVESPVLGTFESIVSKLEVQDGELHPMPLSVKARYIQWWPTPNPFLQLYWLPIPLLMMAGWLVLKDD
ncbi:MAG: hypothetical protein VX519_06955 [Myxococcota bacterium]|nr:hypothetical protein [Myxococcota bacterium]